MELPISIKSIIQLVLLLISLVIVFYVYHMRARKLRNMDDFLSFLTHREAAPYTSMAALRLPRKGRIFCWVMTTPKYHDTRVPAVNQTWLSRCDHGQFFTSAKMSDENVPYTTVFSGFSDDYGDLFWKTAYALYYSYRTISHDFDWYLKADDDTYLVLDNLRTYLSTLNHSEPLFIGFRFKPYLKHGYNSGGAYLLSRGAMALFAEHLFNNETLCPFNEFEDVGIAKCFERLGIFPQDTRDEHGRQRFLAYSVQQTFDGTFADPAESSHWLMDEPRRGYDAFSSELVSVHHMTPEQIRTAELFLYRVRRHQDHTGCHCCSC